MWDGRTDSFPQYKRMVEGYLLQVGVGYLLRKSVVDAYRNLGETYFSTSEFYQEFGVSLPQAKSDILYLYGLLLTTIYC